MANTLYYIWIGLIDMTPVIISSVTDCAPNELLHPHRLHWGILRNDMNSNIIPFEIHENYYQYISQILYNDTDITQLFSGIAPTYSNPQPLSLSGFAPHGAKGHMLIGQNAWTNNAWDDHYVRTSYDGIHYQTYESGYWCYDPTEQTFYCYVSGRLCVPYSFTWYAGQPFKNFRLVLEGWSY